VYDISTKDKEDSMVESIRTVLASIGIESKASSIVGLLRDFGELNSHESFEYGTDITTLRDPTE
jgi:hypothetical protein